MNGVPILLYHSVSDDTSGPLGPYTCSPAAFREQMAWVAGEGFTTLTVRAYAGLLAGREPLPERPLLITFDDGFADFRSNALPVLAEHDLACTMFVSTATTWHDRPRALGGRPTMSWAEVAALPDHGVEVGAHSHDHLQLDLLPAPRVASQLRVCKDQLEQAVGAAVESFAYPHGYHRATTKQLVREAGFTSACAVKNQLSHRDDDLWALARVMLEADQSVPFLRRVADGSAVPPAPSRPSVKSSVWRAVRLAQTRGEPLVAASFV